MSDIELRYQNEILDAVMKRLEVESRSEILPTLDYVLGKKPSPVKELKWEDLPEAVRELWDRAQDSSKLADLLRVAYQWLRDVNGHPDVVLPAAVIEDFAAKLRMYGVTE